MMDNELVALRRDLHAHPEVGFQEHRTARRTPIFRCPDEQHTPDPTS
ncbi:hypothetical protein [Dickeya undicola]|nr:hypothetical protein [Dickeya undicola]